IIEQIAAGCLSADATMREEQRLHLVPDRRAAIHHALGLAAPGDTVLFLGKGHESSIIYKDHVMEWDEASVVAEELRRHGYDGAHQ
ncbi:MAG: UDP-N-acetylmuramyl peptide synthase, partial [Alkalispirochaeta sp.]